MAKGINKVILVGNLGGDPETKYTQGGTAVTSFSLATTDAYKDRNGDRQEKTEWHSIKCFGKLAEIAGEYLRKGAQVYIEGKITYRQVDGNDGQKRYYTDILADQMQMLGSKPDGDRQQQRAPARTGNGARSNAPTQRQAPPRRDNDAQRERATASRDFADDFADDDIPF